MPKATSMASTTDSSKSILETLKELLKNLKEAVERLGFGNKYTTVCEKLDNLNDTIEAGVAADEITGDAVLELCDYVKELKGSIDKLTPENTDEVMQEINKSAEKIKGDLAKSVILYDEQSSKDLFEGWKKAAEELGEKTGLHTYKNIPVDKLESDFEAFSKIYADKENNCYYLSYQGIAIKIESEINLDENSKCTLKLGTSPCQEFNDNISSLTKIVYADSCDSKYFMATQALCDYICFDNNKIFFADKEKAQNYVEKKSLQKATPVKYKLKDMLYKGIVYETKDSNFDLSINQDNAIQIKNINSEATYLINQDEKTREITITLNKNGDEKTICKATPQGNGKILWKYSDIDKKIRDDLGSEGFKYCMSLYNIDKAVFESSFSRDNSPTMKVVISKEGRDMINSFVGETVPKLSNDIKLCVKEKTLHKGNGAKAGTTMNIEFIHNKSGERMFVQFDKNGKPEALYYKNNAMDDECPIANLKTNSIAKPFNFKSQNFKELLNETIRAFKESKVYPELSPDILASLQYKSDDTVEKKTDKQTNVKVNKKSTSVERD